jgi:hypothetical protein
MDKDTLSLLLTQSGPGKEVTVSSRTLYSIFGHGGFDEGLYFATRRFAEEHNCSFAIEPSGSARFLKRSGPNRGVSEITPRESLGLSKPRASSVGNPQPLLQRAAPKSR